jgi:PKD repeat protein
MDMEPGTHINISQYVDLTGISNISYYALSDPMNSYPCTVTVFVDSTPVSVANDLSDTYTKYTSSELAYSGYHTIRVDFTSGEYGSWFQLDDISLNGDLTKVQNPTHIFQSPGLYTISLNASKTGDYDTRTKVDYIDVSPGSPVSNFTATPNTGHYPMTVQFTDTSLYTPTSWAWDFGDGYTSTDRNATHTYEFEGDYSVQYTVTLTVSNTHGSDTSEQLVETISDYIPIANFTGTPTSGMSPLLVNFTDLSSVECPAPIIGDTIETCYPTSWNWSFGDGNFSEEQNPSHVYGYPGIFDVTLVAGNGFGDGERTRLDYIEVTGTGPTPTPTVTPTVTTTVTVTPTVTPTVVPTEVPTEERGTSDIWWAAFFAALGCILLLVLYELLRWATTPKDGESVLKKLP